MMPLRGFDNPMVIVAILAAMIVGTLVKDNVFTTPSQVLVEVQKVETNLKSYMEERYAKKSEVKLQLDAIEKGQKSLTEEVREMKDALKDLAYRDTISGIPVPPGYKLVPATPQKGIMQ